MTKRFMLILAALLLLMLACPASAEDAIKIDLYVRSGAGESVLPDYPDLSARIGEGLTKDDFNVTYSTDHPDLTVEPTTGLITVAADKQFTSWMKVYITYKPKVAGVGTMTTFYFEVYAGRSLKSIVPSTNDVVLGLDQAYGSVRLEENTSYIVDSLKVRSDYDTSVVEVNLPYRSDDAKHRTMRLIPKGVGETTVTIYGYNGVSADVHVKVCEPITELSFARDVFYCYEGEAISLGLKLGEGDVERAAVFSRFTVNGNHGKGEYFQGTDGVIGKFCADTPGDYWIQLTSYNGLEASATVKVYPKKNVTDIAVANEVIRVGETVEILTYDASGNAMRAKNIAVTRGGELASIRENKLTAKGTGEIEITVTNYDGSTCSRTFRIEAYPTEILLNAEELTLEIGEKFELSVGFDQGELDYAVRAGEQDYVYQVLGAVRVEGNTIIAQNPGKAKVHVYAGTLTATVEVTVPESDKALTLVMPPEPFAVGDSFQLYVKDRAGQIYPAAFSTYAGEATGVITRAGYFTATGPGEFQVLVKLEDGRRMEDNISVRKMPKWLEHNAVVVRKSDSVWMGVTSEVGVIDYWELNVAVADERIVKFEKGWLKPQKTGKTTVTVSSIYDETVTTTFTVKVISDTTKLYIGSTTLSVPCGSARYLPVVTDGDGDVVAMKWEITHNNPGDGNPEKSGFVLEGETIRCTWPEASCELTGTIKGGSEYVVVTVKGYNLPENIAIEPAQIWLEVGQSQRVQLTTDDKHGGFGGVLWAAENDGIVSFAEIVEGSANTVLARKPGTTRLAAVLENGAAAVCTVHVYDPQIRLPGDVNEDGAVDARDALLVMQHDAGWRVSINGWQGDVNADGKTDLADAVLIFQYSAGLDVQLKQYIPTN